MRSVRLPDVAQFDRIWALWDHAACTLRLLVIFLPLRPLPRAPESGSYSAFESAMAVVGGGNVRDMPKCDYTAASYFAPRYTGTKAQALADASSKSSASFEAKYYG